MNKNTWIALAMVAVAVAVFFVVRGGSEPVEKSREFGGVTDLERVEIVPAEVIDGPELIVLERRDDGRWWLTRPVQAKLNWEHAEYFEAVFGSSLKTDDIESDGERAESYDLSPDLAVRVALFGAGDDRPAREFMVGREFEVMQTGARRTFVQEVGEDTIYRAQAAFGDLVRLTVDELRDRAIVSVGDEGIEEVRFRHRDGHEVHIEGVGGQWRLVDGPSTAFGLDAQKATRIAATVGRLKATRFVDMTPEEAGLDEPETVVNITTGLAEIEIEIGHKRGEGDEEDRYFLRRDGADDVAEIGESTAKLMMSRLPDLRDRALISGDSSSITEITLAGDDALHLVYDGVDWSMAHPQEGELNARKAQRLAEFVAGLRVERWVTDRQPDEVGLDDDEAPTIRIAWEGEEKFITLGDTVERTRGARYGGYSEEDDVFVLSRSAVERLMGSAESVMGE